MNVNTKSSDEFILPQYFCCYNSYGDKNFLVLEEKRREIINETLLNQLNLQTKVNYIKPY